jgi:hypothetical protein
MTEGQPPDVPQGSLPVSARAAKRGKKKPKADTTKAITGIRNIAFPWCFSALSNTAGTILKKAA